MTSATDVDIVIPTSGNLKFLEVWRPFLQQYHLIIVYFGPPGDTVDVPAGFDYELYTRADVTKLLGGSAWCIPANDAASRCFGFLVSKRKYIITFNDACLVAKAPDGTQVNAIAQHVTNLDNPATPLFFNTLYDPYRKGADFVRGYPFSFREGVPTAVSHGLWLNVPDYDSATRLVKPRERNTRYVDAVMTVPTGVLFPMSWLNLAFNRALIGPAMYPGPIDDQASSRNDDLWAGWCSKVICDHLRVGIKTGLPYVDHASTVNPFESLRGDYKSVSKGDLDVQEALRHFFQGVQFSANATTPNACYEEIAEKVRHELSSVDPYFKKLADGMLAWLQCWEKCNAS